MNTYQPLGNRILVRREKPQEKIGRILLPDAAQKKTRIGEVLAMGPGRFDSILYQAEVSLFLEGRSAKSPSSRDGYAPNEIEVGDVILFGEWAGSEVPDDDTLMVLNADDILAVVSRK